MRLGGDDWKQVDRQRANQTADYESGVNEAVRKIEFQKARETQPERWED